MAERKTSGNTREDKKKKLPSTSPRSVVPRKRALVEAMRKTMGNVSQACQMVGVSRKTYYQYLKEDKKFSEQVDEAREYTFDFVEAKIMQQIRENNVTMMIFFAKTKMKHRGYVERQELSIPDLPVFVVEDKSAKDVKGVMDVIHKHNERAAG